MNGASLLTLSNAYGVVAAAEAACGLGVFERLEKAPASAEELARDLGLEVRATFKLLDALATLGVVTPDGADRFRAGGAARVVEAMRFWNRLADRLVCGATPFAVERSEGANAMYPGVAVPMADAQQAAAEQAAEALAGVGVEVVDVGAGAATWSLALARRDPACRVTLIDRPAVLEVARARIAGAGMEERFSFVAADLTSDEFGKQRYDLALVGNVCHLFGGEQNTALVRKVFAALRPGGTLAVMDAAPEDYDSPSDARLHALSLVLRTSEGDVHPFSSYCAWLRAAGFRGVDRLRVGDDGLRMSVIRARKRP